MGRNCSYGTHNGTRQWMNIEPCGLFCGSMTWFLVLFGMYGTTFEVILPWMGLSILGLLNILLFNTLSLLCIYTHIKAMTTDPGAVPKDARPLMCDDEENDHESNGRDRFKKFCRKCNAFKPARAHHCSICGRCIVKMDHHCPWVNNCVGVGNHKLFLLFIFFIFVTCSYSLVLVFARYLLCSLRNNCGEPVDHLMVIFLVIEGILFGLFTLCMMGDQYTVITTNQTQIDRLKNKKHSFQVEVHEVFGTPQHVVYSWSWVWPEPAAFPSHVRDLIFGYRVENEEVELNPLLGARDDRGSAALPTAVATPLEGPNTSQSVMTATVDNSAAPPDLYLGKRQRPRSNGTKRRTSGTGETTSEDSNYGNGDEGEWLEHTSSPSQQQQQQQFVMSSEQLAIEALGDFEDDTPTASSKATAAAGSLAMPLSVRKRV